MVGGTPSQDLANTPLPDMHPAQHRHDMLLPAPPDSSMWMRLACGCETSATRWQAHCACTTASCAVHVDVVPGSPGGPARLRRRTACSLMRDPMSRYWIRKQGSRVKNRAPSAAGNTMAKMPAAELHALGASLHSGVQPSHSRMQGCSLPAAARRSCTCVGGCALQPQMQCMCCTATQTSTSITLHSSAPATEPAAFWLLTVE